MKKVYKLAIDDGSHLEHWERLLCDECQTSEVYGIQTYIHESGPEYQNDACDNCGK